MAVLSAISQKNRIGIWCAEPRDAILNKDLKLDSKKGNVNSVNSAYVKGKIGENEESGQTGGRAVRGALWDSTLS